MSPMPMFPRFGLGAALAAALLLLTACNGQGEDVASNNSALITAAPGNFTIGNDASAVETVGSSNAAAGIPPMPTGNMAGSAGGAPGDVLTNGAAPAEGNSTGR